MADGNVNRIIADAMDKAYPHPWDGQDKYPVIVETVQRHLVWVEADSLKDAVEGLGGDPDWYEELTPQNQIESGYDWSVEAPEDHNWDWEVYPSTRVQGPRQACTECGTVAHAAQWKPWHKEGCTIAAAAEKQVAVMSDARLTEIAAREATPAVRPGEARLAARQMADLEATHWKRLGVMRPNATDAAEAVS